MAMVSGKCPICSELIKVNNEKDTGFCNKCREKISVQQSIELLNKSDAIVADQPEIPQFEQGRRMSTSQKRNERERAAEARVKVAEAAQQISDMFQLCINERDYLMVRPKIIEMNIADSEKAGLLIALDAATKERLTDVLEKAEKHEKLKESPMNIFLGCLLIIGVGFAINYFFSTTWPGIVAIGLAILGFLGDAGERYNVKKNEEYENAAIMIEGYRQLGYKL